MPGAWYFKRGVIVGGPISEEELRRKSADGEIRPETRVREGASGEWLEAQNLKWIFPPIVRVKPVAPPTDSPPPTSAAEMFPWPAQEDGGALAAERRPRGYRAVILACICIAVVSVLVGVLGRSRPNPERD